MKKIIQVLEEAVIGSLLFTGAVCLVAFAIVYMFRH